MATILEVPVGICAQRELTCILISGITTLLRDRIDYGIVLALPQRIGAVQHKLSRAE
jgi:hypothetical protein